MKDKILIAIFILVILPLLIYGAFTLETWKINYQVKDNPKFIELNNKIEKLERIVIQNKIEIDKLTESKGGK